jgi:hypothetical protein
MLKISWNTGFNNEYYNAIFNKVKHTWDLLPGDVNFYVDDLVPSLKGDCRVIESNINLNECPSILSGNEIKFWKKSRSILSAIKQTMETYDFCIWLDADVRVIKAPIVEKLIPNVDEIISVNNKIVQYDKSINKWENPYLVDLGLDTGFIAFNLKHAQFKNFLNQYENFYRSKDILEIVRKYDTYVLDKILEKNNFKYLNLWNGQHTSGKSYCGFEDSNLEKFFYHYWGKKQKSNITTI